MVDNKCENYWQQISVETLSYHSPYLHMLLNLFVIRYVQFITLYSAYRINGEDGT